MTDQAAAAALVETLPPALRLALLDVAERAVTVLHVELGRRLSAPAKAPAEAELWRDSLCQEVSWRLVRFWNTLEEGQLRAAGPYLCMALFRHLIEQSQAGLDWLRQFGAQPPVSSPAPPTPPAGG